jgi:hypothetical protein
MIDLDAAEQIAIDAVRAAFERLRAPTPTEIEPPEPDSWLTEREAAELIGCQPERLRKHRREGTGPEFERYGRNLRFVKYRKSAVLAWQAANPGRKRGHSDIDDGEDAA